MRSGRGVAGCSPPLCRAGIQLSGSRSSPCRPWSCSEPFASLMAAAGKTTRSCSRPLQPSVPTPRGQRRRVCSAPAAATRASALVGRDHVRRLADRRPVHPLRSRPGSRPSGPPPRRRGPTRSRRPSFLRGGALRARARLEEVVSAPPRRTLGRAPRPRARRCRPPRPSRVSAPLPPSSRSAPREPASVSFASPPFEACRRRCPRPGCPSPGARAN